MQFCFTDAVLALLSFLTDAVRTFLSCLTDGVLVLLSCFIGTLAEGTLLSCFAVT
jgi:hypothetical protein